MARRAGVPYGEAGVHEGQFSLRVLYSEYRVLHPAGLVEDSADGSPASYALGLLVLHYLVHADGQPVAAHWIAFRELPNGLVYDSAFRARVEPPLLRCFGAEPGSLAAPAQMLGGHLLSFADVAYSFLPLPRVPMAVVMHAGDDELPPAASVLFDGSAGHYLPTEDLAVLGGWLVGRLVKEAGRTQS